MVVPIVGEALESRAFDGGEPTHAGGEDGACPSGCHARVLPESRDEFFGGLVVHRVVGQNMPCLG
jgi:hypothetical protein